MVFQSDENHKSIYQSKDLTIPRKYTKIVFKKIRVELQKYDLYELKCFRKRLFCNGCFYFWFCFAYFVNICKQENILNGDTKSILSWKMFVCKYAIKFKQNKTKNN